jgi:hypothetical protein
MDHCSIVTTLIGADRHTTAAVAAHMCVDRLQLMPPPPCALVTQPTAKQQQQNGDEWRQNSSTALTKYHTFVKE